MTRQRNEPSFHDIPIESITKNSLMECHLFSNAFSAKVMNILTIQKRKTAKMEEEESHLYFFIIVELFLRCSRFDDSFLVFVQFYFFALLFILFLSFIIWRNKTCQTIVSAHIFHYFGLASNSFSLFCFARLFGSWKWALDFFHQFLFLFCFFYNVVLFFGCFIFFFLFYCSA